MRSFVGPDRSRFVSALSGWLRSEWTGEARQRMGCRTLTEVRVLGARETAEALDSP